MPERTQPTSASDGGATLPFAELSAIVGTLESLSARLDAIADGIRGTDRGDQQSAELHLIAASVGQGRRRLHRMIHR